MNKIKIITDSTADLRSETYEELDIEVVPLLVNFGEESFKDREEIDLRTLYEKCSLNKDIFPKTSSISPLVFVNVFNKYLDQGYDILFVGIGKELSLTYSAVQMALKEMPKSNGKIKVVDSQNLSSATGWLLMYASRLKDEGKNIDEIAELVEEKVLKMRTFFAVENLQFLFRGGRVSKSKYVLGTMMRAHPVIKVENGKLEVYKTPKGKMIKALDFMLEEVAKTKLENIDLNPIFITHALAEESVVYMTSKLIDLGVPKEQIYIVEAGSVIGTHCGPNTIGVIYSEK